MIKLAHFAISSALALAALLAGGARPASGAEMAASYELSVAFDAQKGAIRGVSLIKPAAPSVVTMSGLKPLKITVNGKPFKMELTAGSFKADSGSVIEIEYEGVFNTPSASGNPENMGVINKGEIAPDGISLVHGWYPEITGLSVFRLKAEVPQGFIAVSESDSVITKKTPSGTLYEFSFEHPVGGITLSAGKFEVFEDSYGKTAIYAYFLSSDKDLALKYLDYTKKYLKMYEEILGPYPYKRFAIVENFLQTGYSMPTYTLLGSDVIKLPFIVETSLGHEIAHQWFGNYVYGSAESGNWLEGLTTYLADYRYKELEGKGAEYRKKILVEYISYVNSENEIPLSEFGQREDFATKAIGYGKGAMVFHMLRGMMGDEAFFKSLREITGQYAFKPASWDDIEKSFEQTSGLKLSWFFDYWVKQKGAISFEPQDVRVVYEDGKPALHFGIRKSAGPERFDIKVKAVYTDGEDIETFSITKESAHFRMPLRNAPLRAEFDPDIDLMRALSPSETPAVISRLLGDKARLVLVPDGGAGAYASLIEAVKAQGFGVMNASDATEKDIKNNSLLFLGSDSPILKRLFGNAPAPWLKELKKPAGVFSVQVMENPITPNHVIALAYASDAEEASLAGRKIFRYGSYSSIGFEKGKNILKGTDDADYGMKFNLVREVSGIKPERKIPLRDILRDIENRQVVYAGEGHTDYQDHMVQFETIKYLHEKGHKVAVGMEMFQTPFQNAIDGYLLGEIHEKEFLKKTEYFKRWKYDYSLYREIINYAKAEGLPIVALNLRSEIVSKVSRSGTESLKKEELAEMPKDMDLSDEKYREGLREIFGGHNAPSGRDFMNFYQAQILWDETMAHSIAAFLKENPDYKMVVLAGMGHVINSSGIPNRVKRILGNTHAILINSSIDTLDAGMADYVIFSESSDAPPSPKMGVVLAEREGRVYVNEVSEGGPAQEAGIEKDDAIVALGDTEVKDVPDIKIFLFDWPLGEALKVKIARKRLLFGEKEIIVEVRPR